VTSEPEDKPQAQWMRRWMLAAACVCAILVIPVVWDARNLLFADSISYLDMAGNALHGSPGSLVTNAYWSPAYPSLLAATMWVGRPTPTGEFPAAHVLDWLLFVLTTACYSLLLANLVRWLSHNTWPKLGGDGALLRAFLLLAYALFLVANMNKTIWYVTPDMLLQGLIYLAAALSIRLFLPGASWKHAMALGAALALGYFTKAAMLPGALLLLGLLFLWPSKQGPGRGYAVAGLLSFLLVCAPLILVLSQEKGRFTFGDSGKLNYSWFVGGVPHFSNWTGRDGSGTPAHIPRRIHEDPPVLEFRTPVSGTLPIWYDPSYWYEGLRIPFNLSRQWQQFFSIFGQVHTMQSVVFGMIALVAALCLLSSKMRRLIGRAGMQRTVFLLWPMGVCLSYYLVLVEYRYIVAYLVLGWIGFAGIGLPSLGRKAAMVTLLSLSALLGLMGAGGRLLPVARHAIKPQTALERAQASDKEDVGMNVVLAGELAKLGIGRGDQLGHIGYSVDNVYYARLLGARVVAQIWEDPEKVSRLSEAQVREVLSTLRSVGVKALLSRSKPGFANDSAWTAIPGTDAWLRLL
jgi:hypothetical protein